MSKIKDLEETMDVDLPPWIKEDIMPKEPRKKPAFDLAVLRFVADGQVHCFGLLDRSVRDNVIQVLPEIKLSRTQPPRYTIRIKFPRDSDSKSSKAQFVDPNFHSVHYTFLPGTYSVEDHVVSDAAELEDFLLHAPKYTHAKAKEAMSQGNLYRITLTFDDNKIQQNFYPNVYSSNVPEIQKEFDAMALVPTAKTISVFQWMYKDLSAHLQCLYRKQREFSSPLQRYLHKHKLGLAAYVQWGKILIPDSEDSFDAYRTFHTYSDYNLINGNAVAREKMKELDLIKKIRNRHVKMTITPAGEDERFYLGFLQFRDFQEAKKLINDAGQGLITWDPPPVVKPQNELAQEEHPFQDRPHGWRAWVITNSTVQHGADVMVFLERPTESWNRYSNKKMPGPASKGDVLQSQLVYYKIFAEVETTERLIKGLAQLRPQDSQGNPEAQIKRAIVCGRDHTNYKTIDIFDGLSDADIAKFEFDLTPSQKDFIFSYCRQIFNGIGLLQGPAGSGKTTIIKALVQVAKKRKVKTAIVTEASSMSDNVVEIIGDKTNLVVRLHSLGLEKRHLLDYANVNQDGPRLPADPVEPLQDQDTDADTFKYTGPAKVLVDTLAPTEDTFSDDVDGWKDDELSITFTDLMLKAARESYENAKKIMHPDDPRMKLINSALWTWMLKVMGFIHDEDESEEVTTTLNNLSKRVPWDQLRSLFGKSEVQHLNEDEWKMYKTLIGECATMFIAEAADSIVCTFAQLRNEWAKNINFSWVIVDEATKMTEAQMISVWRDHTDLVMMIGDHAQLGPTTLSKVMENPFVPQLTYSPFHRFVDNGYPYMMLREVMRSTTGLEAMCSDLFYSSQLKPGIHTSLKDRPLSTVWQKEIHLKYPTLRAEPSDLVYPVFLSIFSESKAEITGGTSRINSVNMTVVIGHLLWVVCEVAIAKPGQIGIASPYAGQVEYYRRTMKKIQDDKPEEDWSAVRIGTTEWFQGREAPYMIVDLVRGSNDFGDLGFMSEGRRLNVLFSRAKEALVIVGDKDCVKYSGTGDKKEDDKIEKRRNENNRHLLKAFAWLDEHGRRYDVPADTISSTYIDLEPPVEESEKVDDVAQVDPASQGEWMDTTTAAAAPGRW